VSLSSANAATALRNAVPIRLNNAGDGTGLPKCSVRNVTTGIVTCPAGITVQITARRHAPFGRHCATCPSRKRCTTAAQGRAVVLHPHHALLAAARAFATTDAFNHTYRRHRPMVERSIAWLVRGTNRRLRYRGTARNRLWLGHRVAAINLHRLVNLGLTHSADGWAIT
jgi:hypothetical protein